MIKSKNILILLFIIVIGCKDAANVYLGIPLQPRFDNNSFAEGLNIFGIIRVDSANGYNNSFVELQKIIPAVGAEDSILVDTSSVIIENTIEQKIFEFSLTNADSTFSQANYRPSNNFSPSSGDIFRIECTSMELPVLTAHTIVPQKPKWRENSLEINHSSISFNLLPDSTIFMYDLYVFCHGAVCGYSRIASENDSTDTHVIIDISTDAADSIVAYGYDYNLAGYYLTSNVSLNFNKYRESFSMVENGFGVFGSVNSNIFVLEK
jgi:hypothetical protein